MSNWENPEDAKLATLATATLTRSQAGQAAALRDNTGRTYVAINVSSVGLKLDALEAVLTVALASGISGIEAVVVTGELPTRVAVIKDFTATAKVYLLAGSGEVTEL